MTIKIGMKFKAFGNWWAVIRSTENTTLWVCQREKTGEECLFSNKRIIFFMNWGG